MDEMNEVMIEQPKQKRAKRNRHRAKANGRQHRLDHKVYKDGQSIMESHLAHTMRSFMDTAEPDDNFSGATTIDTVPVSRRNKKCASRNGITFCDDHLTNRIKVPVIMLEFIELCPPKRFITSKLASEVPVLIEIDDEPDIIDLMDGYSAIICEGRVFAIV